MAAHAPLHLWQLVREGAAKLSAPHDVGGSWVFRSWDGRLQERLQHTVEQVCDPVNGSCIDELHLGGDGGVLQHFVHVLLRGLNELVGRVGPHHFRQLVGDEHLDDIVNHWHHKLSDGTWSGAGCVSRCVSIQQHKIKGRTTHQMDRTGRARQRRKTPPPFVKQNAPCLASSARESAAAAPRTACDQGRRCSWVGT